MNYELLEKLPEKIKTFANTLRLRYKFKGEEVSILKDNIYLEFKNYLLINWFQLQSRPDLLLTDKNASTFRQKEADETVLKVATELLGIENKKLDLLLLFLNEIIKMQNDIPRLAKEAISTGNPFLFRSLFLSFQEAEEFAVGGKLNSSLETKYGNLLRS